MLCKLCNTRIRRGRSFCPNCGSHSISKAPTVELESVGKLPELPVPAASSDSPEVEPEVVELNEPAEVEAEVDVALDEATTMDFDDPDDDGRDESDLCDDAEEAKEEAPPAVDESRTPTQSSFGTPDAAAVRRLLADKPAMLEPGLEVYKSEKGTPLGAGYTSAVGEIDLLARDADGDLVVVMVAEPHAGADLVSVVLQRIGWVRKHLGGGAKRVRGIVLMDQPLDAIAYAASAVADTVSFKTFRMALTFEDLEF